MAENGSVVELQRSRVAVVDRIDAGVMFVDGLAVGDVSDVALRDRRRLSEDGILIIVATVNGAAPPPPPELIARGFPEGEPLLEETRAEAERVLDECVRNEVAEVKLLQEHLHDSVGQLIYDRTGRRPRILPVVVEL